MAAITRKEIVRKLIDARSSLNLAASRTYGSQQQHLNQQWAYLNDMIEILACNNSNKLNQILESAKHWEKITEKKS